MDAAFVISTKTRHDRTELQSPDQNAANSDASWFFGSVIGLSFFETAVSKSGWIPKSTRFNLSKDFHNVRLKTDKSPPPRYSPLHLRVPCDPWAAQAS